MFRVFGQRKVPGWMAIVPGDSRVDIAHIHCTAGERPRVTRLESLPGTAEHSFTALRAQGAFRQHHCTTLLRQNQYRFILLEAPAVPPEERLQALRWRLKDVVDFPPDTAALGVLDIPQEQTGSGRPANVFVAAAGRQTIADCMSRFAEAKLALEAIDVPETALRNVLTHLEEPNRGLACLALIDGDAWFVITYGGELFLSRRIDTSAALLAEASGERRQVMLERIVLELQRTLDTFDRQFSFISISRLLVACEQAVPDLLPYLQGNLYIQVREFRFGEAVDFSACPAFADAAAEARAILPIGAALRSCERVTE